MGALLRSEGLYSSQLASGRKQRKDGTVTDLESRRSRPLLSAEAAALVVVRAENERLTRQLASADATIEIQKMSPRTWR